MEEEIFPFTTLEIAEAQQPTSNSSIVSGAIQY
jgi:hypothetical protein